MNTDARKSLWYVLLPLIAVYAVIVLKNAWVGDDAYITLRTIDNFVNGYGLTWNVVERVQAYTHPLWLLVLTIFYAITREPFYTTLFVSVALSLAAVSVFSFKIARTTVLAALGLAVLILSDAFVDYSTSGLENPLTHFLLIVFLLLYFRREHSVRQLGWLTLIAALGACNRLDTLLIFLPMLVHVFWNVRSRRAIHMAVIGFLPLIVWEIFSLWYYGFLFPNTAYAKLSTGLSGSWMWVQGLRYLEHSILVDPLTMAVIAGSLILALVTRHRRLIAPAVAILLYLLYIVSIGGCFMAGRYLAAPVLLAVVIFSQYDRRISRIAVAVAGGLILALGLISSHSPLYASRSDCFNPDATRHGITDERACATPTHSLINYPSHPVNKWAEEGKTARESGRPFMTHVAVGMVGYYGGPGLFILDINALTDPLLAHLPVNGYYEYRIGHFNRDVPTGYRESCRTDENHLHDPYLAEYYDHLRRLTRGDLFNWERLGEVLTFNLGSRNHLLEDYLRPHLLKVPYADISRSASPGTDWVEVEYVVVSEAGIEIEIDSQTHAKRLEISRGRGNRFRAVYLSGGRELAAQVIPADEPAGWGLAVMRMTIPAEAAEPGYTSIRIIPDGPDQAYVVSHLRVMPE